MRRVAFLGLILIALGIFGSSTLAMPPVPDAPTEIPDSKAHALAVVGDTLAYRINDNKFQVSLNPSALHPVWETKWTMWAGALELMQMQNGNLLIGSQRIRGSHDDVWPHYCGPGTPDGKTPIYIYDPAIAVVDVGFCDPGAGRGISIANWAHFAQSPTTGEIAAGEGLNPPALDSPSEAGPRVWIGSPDGRTWILGKQFDPVQHTPPGQPTIGYKHIHEIIWYGATLYVNTGDAAGYRETWRRDPVSKAWSQIQSPEGHTAAAILSGRIYFGSDASPYGVYEFNPEHPEWGMRLLLNIDNAPYVSYIAELWTSPLTGVLWLYTNGAMTSLPSPIVVLASPDGGWTWHEVVRDTMASLDKSGILRWQEQPIHRNGILGWWIHVSTGGYDSWFVPDLTPAQVKAYPVVPRGT